MKRAIGPVWWFNYAGSPCWLLTCWGRTARRTSTCKQIPSPPPSPSPSPSRTSERPSCSFRTRSSSIRKTGSTLSRASRRVTRTMRQCSKRTNTKHRSDEENFFHPPLNTASFRKFKSWGEEEQVCVPEGGLWRLLHRGEGADGVLPVWIHLHPDGQTHLQPRRHWWGGREQCTQTNTQKLWLKPIWLP